MEESRVRYSKLSIMTATKRFSIWGPRGPRGVERRAWGRGKGHTDPRERKGVHINGTDTEDTHSRASESGSPAKGREMDRQTRPEAKPERGTVEAWCVM